MQAAFTDPSSYLSAALEISAGTAVLIDVREPAEWQESGVASPAILLPMSSYKDVDWELFIRDHKEQKCYLYCRSGGRAGMMSTELGKLGIDAVNLGHFTGWASSGLPVKKVDIRAVLKYREAFEQVKNGQAVLVDVREPAEWNETGVAEPAVLLPLSAYKSGHKDWDSFLANLSGKRVYLYCRSGGRAGMMELELDERGVDAVNIGGFEGWRASGLPVRKVRVGERERL